MKIDISPIVRMHFRTLKHENGQVSLQDYIIFLVIPAAFAIYIYYSGTTFREQAYEISITALSIFAALLLTVQVALFSIFERKWEKPSDKKSEVSFRMMVDKRTELLTELNTNIAYLVILSVFMVLMCIVFFLLNDFKVFASSLMTFAFLHFFLTLIMIIKRTFALFHIEYGS